jgi:ABC-type Fe3+ transport system permease subunit
MEMKWTNLLCFVLVIFSVWLLIHMQESVVAFLSALGQLGPEHSTDEKFWGLIAFSVVAIVLVGVLTVLRQNRQ